MTDSPRTQEASQEVPAQRTDGSDASWAPAMLALQLLASSGLAVLIVCNSHGDSVSGIEILLCALLLFSAIWAGSLAARIRRDLSRLGAILPEVQKGREPIESVSRFGAGVSPLAEICRDILRDLRQERARTSRLQEETRQKVASRTEALERTIGALRQQAARDGLTGLFNRRMLDAYLPEAIERCKTSALPLCLLMIDVDHFKLLNDTLGHAAGDQMLRSIAQIIRSTIGENDLAFRNGGDEFVVVLEGCNAELGRSKADRLNSLGNALGRTFRLTPPPTLSVGLTMLADLKDPNAPALLRQADQALYQVKAEHHAALSGAHPRARSA